SFNGQGRRQQRDLLLTSSFNCKHFSDHALALQVKEAEWAENPGNVLRIDLTPEAYASQKPSLIARNQAISFKFSSEQLFCAVVLFPECEHVALSVRTHDEIAHPRYRSFGHADFAAKFLHLRRPAIH